MSGVDSSEPPGSGGAGFAGAGAGFGVDSSEPPGSGGAGFAGAGAGFTRLRVLVREPIAEAGIELLRRDFDVDVDPASDLAAVIGRYDGIVIRSATRLTA